MIIIAVVPAVLHAGMFFALPGCQTRPTAPQKKPVLQQATKSVLNDEIARTMKAWQLFLDRNIPAGSNPRNAVSKMEPFSRDWGWWSTGGSGRTTYSFIIDDYLEARLKFDPNDQLDLAFIRMRTKGLLWVTGPDHQIIKIPIGTEIEEPIIMEVLPEEVD